MKWRTGIATLAILWSMATTADNLVIPVDVNELINERGCSQVADFYLRPAVEKPPYALVEDQKGKRQLAVWCTKDGAKPDYERLYTLILKFDDASNPLARCQDHIDDMDSIGGLEFAEISEPAEWYYSVDTSKPIAAKGTLRTTAIKSIYDGTGHYFVCIDGQWAMRMLH